MVCLDCGYTNAPRTDVCEACGAQLLADRGADHTEFDEHLMTDVVELLEPRTPITVPAETSVADSIAVMREHRVGCVLVTEGDQVAGIFTERDLLSKVLADGHAPHDVAVHQVMTRDPVVLRWDDSLAVALNKMVMGAFRHIPLVDATGNVNGIVSARDLMARLYELMQETGTHAAET